MLHTKNRFTIMRRRPSKEQTTLSSNSNNNTTAVAATTTTTPPPNVVTGTHASYMVNVHNLQNYWSDEQHPLDDHNGDSDDDEDDHVSRKSSNSSGSSHYHDAIDASALTSVNINETAEQKSIGRNEADQHFSSNGSYASNHQVVSDDDEESSDDSSSSSSSIQNISLSSSDDEDDINGNNTNNNNSNEVVNAEMQKVLRRGQMMRQSLQSRKAKENLYASGPQLQLYSNMQYYQQQGIQTRQPVNNTTTAVVTPPRTSPPSPGHKSSPTGSNKSMQGGSNNNAIWLSEDKSSSPSTDQLHSMSSSQLVERKPSQQKIISRVPSNRHAPPSPSPRYGDHGSVASNHSTPSTSAMSSVDYSVSSQSHTNRGMMVVPPSPSGNSVTSTASSTLSNLISPVDWQQLQKDDNQSVQSLQSRYKRFLVSGDDASDTGSVALSVNSCPVYASSSPAKPYEPHVVNSVQLSSTGSVAPASSDFKAKPRRGIGRVLYNLRQGVKSMSREDRKASRRFLPKRGKGSSRSSGDSVSGSQSVASMPDPRPHTSTRVKPRVQYPQHRSSPAAQKALNTINAETSLDLVNSDEPQLYVLLLDPKHKLFEIVAVEYTDSTTVGDVLSQARTAASDPALAQATYTSLLQGPPHHAEFAAPMLPARFVVPPEGTSILVAAVPQGWPAPEIARLTRVLQHHPRIQRWLARMDPFARMTPEERAKIAGDKADLREKCESATSPPKEQRRRAEAPLPPDVADTLSPTTPKTKNTLHRDDSYRVAPKTPQALFKAVPSLPPPKPPRAPNSTSPVSSNKIPSPPRPSARRQLQQQQPQVPMSSRSTNYNNERRKLKHIVNGKPVAQHHHGSRRTQPVVSAEKIPAPKVTRRCPVPDITPYQPMSDDHGPKPPVRESMDRDEPPSRQRNSNDNRSGEGVHVMAPPNLQLPLISPSANNTSAQPGSRLSDHKRLTNILGF